MINAVFFIKLIVFIINNDNILNLNIMDKNLDKTLDNFLEDESTNQPTKDKSKNNDVKKVRTKDGLIERVDRKLIVEDGRQMLLD